jgi:hypothetical protein
MAEIKSTMDIIMEKTKGLTMSEEEKAEYKHQELTGKVKGVIQKFLDGILDLDKLKAEMTAFAGKQEGLVRGLIIEESIHHIHLGRQNEPIYLILRETAVVDAGAIQEMEKAFIDRIEEKRAVYEKSLRDQLGKKGVSGSAVIPNLKAYPDWQQFVSSENESFRAKIHSSIESS